MTMYDEDDSIPPDLAGLIADLPVEIQPAGDLWTEVRSEIEPVPRPTPAEAPRWASLAGWLGAGLVAAAAIFAISTRLVPTPAPPTPLAQLEPARAAEQWEVELRQTTEELLAVVDAHRDELDPEAVQVLERALIELDSAIEDVRGALAEDPNNDALEAALAGVYERKVELLRSTADVGVGG